MSRPDCRHCDHPNPKRCGCGFGHQRDARQPQMYAELGLQLADPEDSTEDEDDPEEDAEEDDDRMEFPGRDE